VLAACLSKKVVADAIIVIQAVGCCHSRKRLLLLLFDVLAAVV